MTKVDETLDSLRYALKCLEEVKVADSNWHFFNYGAVSVDEQLRATLQDVTENAFEHKQLLRFQSQIVIVLHDACESGDLTAAKQLLSQISNPEKAMSFRLDQISKLERSLRGLADALEKIIARWYAEMIDFFGDDEENRIRFDALPEVIAGRAVLEDAKSY